MTQGPSRGTCRGDAAPTRPFTRDDPAAKPAVIRTLIVVAVLIAALPSDGPAANPLYPSLAGQSAAFLDGQLRLWRDGVRGGSAAAPIMENLTDGLTDREITALAAYYSNLRPQGRRRGHATAEEP